MTATCSRSHAKHAERLRVSRGLEELRYPNDVSRNGNQRRPSAIDRTATLRCRLAEDSRRARAAFITTQKSAKHVCTSGLRRVLAFL